MLNVGDILGLKNGDNPHRWYNPANVQTVISALVGDLQPPRSGRCRLLRAQRAHFDNVALAPYHSLIKKIRAAYTGTPVGASESIFSMLAPALGLRLITPYTFLRAISEGTDVSAADKSTIDNQIKHHKIKIYVYNSQNTHPGRPSPASRMQSRGDSDDDHHRDAGAGQRDLPGLADQHSSRGYRRRWSSRRPPRRRVQSGHPGGAIPPPDTVAHRLDVPTRWCERRQGGLGDHHRGSGL